MGGKDAVDAMDIDSLWMTRTLWMPWTPWTVQLVQGPHAHQPADVHEDETGRNGGDSRDIWRSTWVTIGDIREIHMGDIREIHVGDVGPKSIHVGVPTAPSERSHN